MEIEKVLISKPELLTTEDLDHKLDHKLDHAWSSEHDLVRMPANKIGARFGTELQQSCFKFLT